MNGLEFAATIALGAIIFVVWCYWPVRAGDQEQ